MAKREDWIKDKKNNYENELSSIIKSVVKPSMASASKFEVEISLNWYKIIGADMYSKIELKRLKPVERGKKIYNLYVSVFGRDSLEISHNKDLIVEKVNTFLGYGAVKDVVISNDRKMTADENKKYSYDKFNYKKEVIASESKLDYKHYGIEDEGLVEVLRNIERNIGENDEK